jgi:hypothetical protein
VRWRTGRAIDHQTGTTDVILRMATRGGLLDGKVYLLALRPLLPDELS